MREMTRKVGQRFMVGFDGLEASSDVKRLVRDFGVGHIILFSRNVDEPEQVAELVQELQEVARNSEHPLPLLVAVDQEGGRVARLREPWTSWPALRELGRTGSEDLARGMGEGLAVELRACGIRLDFAPVVDVDTNPKNPVIHDRSFGADPDVVARLGAAMIQGLQDAGVAACAKHFPGHGDTDLDSHLDLPAVDHALSRLSKVEWPPFRSAIERKVATIMTAHVLVRQIDDAFPATLSPAVVQGVLRKEMHFAGVVVADDLNMSAVAKKWRSSAAAVLAVKAGCDILPICTGIDAQVEGIEAVVHAVEAEEIPWSLMDEAGVRIKRLKELFALPHEIPSPKGARQAAGSRETFAQRIRERARLGPEAKLV